MSLYDDLQKKLSPEIFTQVTDALGDDFEYDVVPRSRLNKVIKQRRDLKEQLAIAIAGTQQPQGSEDDDDDFDDGQKNQKRKTPSKKEPQKSIEELQAEWERNKKAEMDGLRIQYAGLDKLREVGAVDPDVAFSLLDKSKLSIKEDGSIEGLTEQITALQESKKYLFGATQKRKQTPGGTGKDGDDNQFNGVNSIGEFMKLSTKDQAAFKQAYPDKFKEFLNSNY